MVITTILVGLLPLTAAVMLHSTRVIGPLRLFALVVGIALGSMHRVHDEAHWPTDVVGGVLIGACNRARCRVGDRSRGMAPAMQPAVRGLRTVHAGTAGTVPLQVDVARLLGLASHLAAAAVAILLAVLAVTRGIPADPEGILLDPAIQRPVQLGLAGLVSIGALVSWRFPASVRCCWPSPLLVWARSPSLQFEPRTALALTALVAIPAVLLWLSWQHRRRHGEIVAWPRSRRCC